ncbi:MAG: hypothetical protein F6J87_29000 [Spirulina sp. SIO3F2]|nr:hypothetical protein [Spirulina sp. SIO3F2]
MITPRSPCCNRGSCAIAAVTACRKLGSDGFNCPRQGTIPAAANSAS